jgi:hypothetical protein
MAVLITFCANAARYEIDMMKTVGAKFGGELSIHKRKRGIYVTDSDAALKFDGGAGKRSPHNTPISEQSAKTCGHEGLI